MTRPTNARIAGSAFLLYIAVGVVSMILGGTGSEGTAAQLAHIARHTSGFRVVILLAPVLWFCAIILAVTLYALTRDEDPDLAMLVMACRVGEGVVGAAGTVASLGLLWLATAGGPAAPDPASASGLPAFLFEAGGWNTTISAVFFAVGSTVFSYLLLRGRMVPVILAWLGVVASAALAVGLPLRMAGFLPGSVVMLLWIPMALFEVPLGFWLIIKGVARRAVPSPSA